MAQIADGDGHVPVHRCRGLDPPLGGAARGDGGRTPRHDEILRAAVELHDGFVVKSTGDGVHAVFAAARRRGRRGDRRATRARRASRGPTGCRCGSAWASTRARPSCATATTTGRRRTAPRDSWRWRTAVRSCARSRRSGSSATPRSTASASPTSASTACATSRTPNASSRSRTRSCRRSSRRCARSARTRPTCPNSSRPSSDVSARWRRSPTRCGSRGPSR